MKKNNKVIIIAVAIAILILILGVCLFIYMRESNKQKNNVSVGKIDGKPENTQTSSMLEDGMRLETKLTVADLKEKLGDTAKIEVKNASGEKLEDDGVIGTGATIISNGNEYKVTVVGDVNGDGKTTVTDIVKMNLHMLKIEELDEASSKAADITGDGKVSLTDITAANLINIRIKDVSDYIKKKETNTEGNTQTETETNSQAVESKYKIGDKVNYKTTLNGVELNDWQVFYEKDGYTYLIYGDVLPSRAINVDEINNSNGITKISISTSGVDAEDRASLLGAMRVKAKWDSLLHGTINGKDVNEERTENVWAMGSPTIELWVDSWNSKYTNNKLYIATESEEQNDQWKGYYVGKEENPTTTFIKLDNTEGADDSLYFVKAADLSVGYWLASPGVSADNSSTNGVMNICYNGRYVAKSESNNNSGYQFRPVICLPNSVINQ